MYTGIKTARLQHRSVWEYAEKCQKCNAIICTKLSDKFQVSISPTDLHINDADTFVNHHIQGQLCLLGILKMIACVSENKREVLASIIIDVGCIVFL